MDSINQRNQSSLEPLPDGFLDELWSPAVSTHTRIFLLNTLMSFNDVTLTAQQHIKSYSNQLHISPHNSPRKAEHPKTDVPITKQDINQLQLFIFSSLSNDLTGPIWDTPDLQSTLFRLLVNNHLAHVRKLKLQLYPTLKIGQFFRNAPPLNTPSYSILASLTLLRQLDSLEFVILRDISCTENVIDGIFQPFTDPMAACLFQLFDQTNISNGRNSCNISQNNTLFSLPHLKSFKLSSTMNSFFPDLTPLTSLTSFPSLQSLSLPTIDLGQKPGGLDELVQWIKGMKDLKDFHLSHRFHHTPMVNTNSKLSTAFSLVTCLFPNSPTTPSQFESSEIHSYITSLDLDYSSELNPGPSLSLLFHSPFFSSQNQLKKLSISQDKIKRCLASLHIWTPLDHGLSHPSVSQSLGYIGDIAGLSGLEELILIGLEVLPDVIQQFVQSPHLQNLLSLSLINIRSLRHTTIPLLSSPTSTIRKLKELCIAGCGEEVERNVHYLVNDDCTFIKNLQTLTLSYAATPNDNDDNIILNQNADGPIEPITTLLTSPHLSNLTSLNFTTSRLSYNTLIALSQSTVFQNNLKHFSYVKSLEYRDFAGVLFNNNAPLPSNIQLLWKQKYDHIFDDDYQPQEDEFSDEEDEWNDWNDGDDWNDWDGWDEPGPEPQRGGIFIEDDNDEGDDNNNNNDQNSDHRDVGYIDDSNHHNQDNNSIVVEGDWDLVQEQGVGEDETTSSDQNIDTPSRTNDIPSGQQSLPTQSKSHSIQHQNILQHPISQLAHLRQTITTKTSPKNDKPSPPSSCFAPNLTSLELSDGYIPTFYHLALSPHLGYVEKLKIGMRFNRCFFHVMRKYLILASNITSQCDDRLRTSRGCNSIPSSLSKATTSIHSKSYSSKIASLLHSLNTTNSCDARTKCWKKYEELIATPRVVKGGGRLGSLFGYPTLNHLDITQHRFTRDIHSPQPPHQSHKCFDTIPELSRDLKELGMDCGELCAWREVGDYSKVDHFNPVFLFKALVTNNPDPSRPSYFEIPHTRLRYTILGLCAISLFGVMAGCWWAMYRIAWWYYAKLQALSKYFLPQSSSTSQSHRSSVYWILIHCILRTAFYFLSNTIIE